MGLFSYLTGLSGDRPNLTHDKDSYWEGMRDRQGVAVTFLVVAIIVGGRDNKDDGRDIALSNALFSQCN